MYTYSNSLFAWRAFRILLQYLMSCGGNYYCHRKYGLFYTKISKKYPFKIK